MAEYAWVLLDADKRELRATEAFASKEDAEAWMGREWSALLEEGAESVVLKSGERTLYEMGLRAE